MARYIDTLSFDIHLCLYLEYVDPLQGTKLMITVYTERPVLEEVPLLF